MKTIFSFDGGGVRGAITVAFLERIEQVLQEVSGRALVKNVNLAGGTSTGAIIAAAVSLGYSAQDVRRFYFDLAPKVFQRSRSRIPGIQSRFKAKLLKNEIVELCGERTLGSPDLQTGFALALKRMDTGSPWILSNNPNNLFWNDPVDGSYLGNRHYRLADVLRASTAAPHYFEPERIKIMEGQPPGLFVDGGVSPYNNPALGLLQMVTIPSVGYGWETGIDKLRIVSIGTGSFRDLMDPASARRLPAAGLAVKALTGLINNNSTQVLALMQMLGETPTRWTINSEIGDLSGVLLAKEPLFHFLRYDVRLEKDWLRQELDIDISDSELTHLRLMDQPKTIPRLYEIATLAAKIQVKKEHFLPS